MDYKTRNNHQILVTLKGLVVECLRALSSVLSCVTFYSHL